MAQHVYRVLPAVIVCSCNVLSDNDVRTAAASTGSRRPSEVYGCLGCSAECGRCVRTIRRIMAEALGAAEEAFEAPEDASCPGCPQADHSHS